MFKVYAIKFDGKVIYVGQTGMTIDTRFSEHISRATKGDNRVPKLYEHMRSHDKNRYTFELLELTNKEQRYEREKYWIAHFDTRKNGCNKTIGGITACGSDHYSFGKPPEKAIKASVAARIGKKLTEEHKKKISIGNIGTKRPSLCCKIQCIETGVVYDSMRSAAKALNVNENYVSQQIRGKLKQVNNYTFRRL